VFKAFSRQCDNLSHLRATACRIDMRKTVALQEMRKPFSKIVLTIFENYNTLDIVVSRGEERSIQNIWIFCSKYLT